MADLPPLPEFSLTEREPLLPPFSDKILTLFLPVAAYWALSMVFHCMDTFNYLSAYRLHTPEEISKRNRVSRFDVVRDVIVQQVIQTAVGLLLVLLEPVEYHGREEYDIAVWARRIRTAERVIPFVLAAVSIDAKGLAQKLVAYPSIAAVLARESLPSNTSVLEEVPFHTQAIGEWEIQLATAMYWVMIPAAQFFIAIVALDAWQYFLHRAMHMNTWLYKTFHSRHHRLYVPYAYGALYNHPFEGFLLETIGAVVAYKLAGLNTRQCMCFFTFATLKTVDDHCGYALPWDPLQHITSNNAAYHDIHHQSWGIKANFSQPFFTFWDRLLGTRLVDRQLVKRT